jgi:hypothetical protein
MKPSTLPRSAPPTDERIERLFLRLGTIYGSVWFDRWRDAPAELVKAEWSRGLARFDVPTIRRALDWCAENQKFPPTLPDFIAACKDALPRPESFALLAPPRATTRDRAEGQRHLADLLARMKARAPH